MVDGSWTSIAQFSGCGWDWRDGFEKKSTYGDAEFKKARDCIAV